MVHNKMRRTFLNLFLGLIIVSFGCEKNESEGEIVAQVGNVALRREALNRRMAWEGATPEQESEFVDQWVNRELLYQEAKRLDLDKSEELAWELELVEKEFLIQKLLERTFVEKVQITEDEVNAYYRANIEEYKVDEDELRALHILTKSKAQADLAYQEIIAGKPFETVAREYSEGMFRDQGGNMGFFSRGHVIPEISRNAFRLSVGRVSRVFSSAHGYHILKVLKKRIKGEYKELVDVRDEIFQQLRVEKERAAYYELLFQLQKTTRVNVSIPKESGEMIDSTSANNVQN